MNRVAKINEKCTQVCRSTMNNFNYHNQIFNVDNSSENCLRFYGTQAW